MLDLNSTALLTNVDIDNNTIDMQATSTGAGLNEVQRITLPSGTTGGSFDLTYHTDPAVTVTTFTAAGVQSALESSASLSPGDVLVTEAVAGEEWLVEFTGALAETNVPELDFNGSGVSPSSGGFVETEIEGGSSAEAELEYAAILYTDSYLFGQNLAVTDNDVTIQATSSSDNADVLTDFGLIYSDDYLLLNASNIDDNTVTLTALTDEGTADIEVDYSGLIYADDATILTNTSVSRNTVSLSGISQQGTADVDGGDAGLVFLGSNVSMTNVNMDNNTVSVVATSEDQGQAVALIADAGLLNVDDDFLAQNTTFNDNLVTVSAEANSTAVDAITDSADVDMVEAGLIYGRQDVQLVGVEITGNMVTVSASSTGQDATDTAHAEIFSSGVLYSDDTMTLTNTMVTGNTVSVSASSAGSTAEAYMDQGLVYSDDEVLLTNVDLSSNTVTLTATTTGTDPTDSATAEIKDAGILYTDEPVGMSRTRVNDNTITVTATAATGSADAKVIEGGIFLDEQAALNDVTIDGNTVAVTATSTDGDATVETTGMLHVSDELTMSHSTVSNNTTTATATSTNAAATVTPLYGGGIYGESDVVLNNVDVTGNTIEAITTGGTTETSDVRGGGIYAGGNLAFGTGNVNNSAVLSDDAGQGLGGGIFAAAEANLADVTIDGNTASEDGGGLYFDGNYYGKLLEVTTNTATAGDGGGVYTKGEGTLVDTTVSSNTAGGDGGGIFNDPPMWIFNSTIDNNLAVNGGGIYTSADLNLRNATVSTNTATSEGGGLYATDGTTNEIQTVTLPAGTTGGSFILTYDDGTTTEPTAAINIPATAGDVQSALENVTLIGAGNVVVTEIVANEQWTVEFVNALANTNVRELVIDGNLLTPADGGSVAETVQGALVTGIDILHATFSDNTATTGGGIFVDPVLTPPLTITNTIVANSTGGDLSGTVNSGGFNLIEDASAVTGDTTGNLSGDPLLGPLAANGGPTNTHVLLIGSPARNAGDATQSTATDQRRVNRPFGASVDIGAFEAQPPAPVDGDFNDDGFYDCLDIDALIGQIVAGFNALAFDMTGDGLVNLDDRDAWLAEAGEVNLGPGKVYLLGDANLDGFVLVEDFNIWNTNKFQVLAEWCSGDFNADGFVDVRDFNIWNLNRFLSSDRISQVVFPLWPGELPEVLGTMHNTVTTETCAESSRLFPDNAPSTVKRIDAVFAAMHRAGKPSGQRWGGDFFANLSDAFRDDSGDL